ncbi:MAG: hypothetical protein FD174_104 [Geobacteraceae bacterium]|nr:MAG: hypothetical protein FD174_104 [Geobacteraceae bacterium]
MERLLMAFILLTGLLCASVSAQASPYYTSSVQDLGSGRWQYDYTVTNAGQHLHPAERWALSYLRGEKRRQCGLLGIQ